MTVYEVCSMNRDAIWSVAFKFYLQTTYYHLHLMSKSTTQGKLYTTTKGKGGDDRVNSMAQSQPYPFKKIEQYILKVYLN